jgi:hypothetical protein
MIGKQNGNDDGVLEYTKNGVIKKNILRKNILKALQSEIKVLSLH